MKLLFSLALLAASSLTVNANGPRHMKISDVEARLDESESVKTEEAFWERELRDSTSMHSTPPLNECGMSDDKRREDIMQILEEVSSKNKLNNPKSPQYKAMEWLSLEDELFLCPGVNDKKLIQRYAMAVFYFSTEGEGWKECFAGDDSCGSTDNDFSGKKPYLSPVNECEWAGVKSCNDDLCIVEIVFEEENDLKGTIPDELGVLEALEVLSLENQAIGGSIPSTLGDIEPLRVIDFDFNQLTGTIPDSIYGLENLEQLDLNDNKLTGTISSDIKDLTSLKFLQVHFNDLEGTLPNSLSTLENLRVAEFQVNGFTGTVPLCIGDSSQPMLLALTVDCAPPNPEITCGDDCGCECF